MLNRIVLIGRLTKEPDLRYTTSGIAVAKFTLAVDRRVSKDREKETDFIDIVVWQKLAETCANYLGKGRLVAVEGRLHVRSYEDNQGVRRKAAEVVADNVRFLDRAKEAGAVAGENQGYGSEIGFNEDDIPF
ncbi:single-stranded DNA-binding protein [Pelotomaculum sp. PtaB.Bin117]|uniref:single-stranded DNA-binding protein n=1 Tax=Pelotomaculum sp. PtaB.Bin117 TaxID=1811694 RepID=UPI0009CD93D5|nr:single-stranded DNA-binding protein [Pelotomaculum sp. PtaB.Bin117]OPX91382.1 MAG: Single-stranded DNA-binding protein ssb [Pelotomaculum sp. PtaB.Bin117]OPY59377.1 MAG: Single-stranded DNA-binding protein ssb [Pelotomaculum sp. PtaU1.Bin065]